MKSPSYLFLRGISAAIFVMLSACGGQNTGGGSPATQYAAPPTISSTSITFNGYRANYQITGAPGSMLVVDKFGSDGETKVGSQIEQLIFKDVSVNLALPNLIKTMNEKDVVAIIELYIAYFKRVPDANGLNYWCNQFKQGMSLERIGESFYAAGLIYSSVTGYTPNMTNDEFVRIVYKNVLGRDNPDAEGLAYWTNALAAGRETRGTLVRTMLYSAHSFKGTSEFGWVADLLDNRISVGRDFAITRGFTYLSDSESITKGMQIASLVSSVGTNDAISMLDVVSGLKVPTAEVGIFRDSFVGGIKYVATAPNGTQRTGVTNEKGQYQFFPYGKIEFYLGAIFLGRVENATATTATAFLASEPTATNIARLLQTLDIDNDPSNGIYIPQTVVQNAERVQSLDLSSTNFEASFSSIRDDLLRNSEISTRTLVSSLDASEHAERAARIAANTDARLVRAIEGKLSYPSSYNVAVLKSSEFQRVRQYIWDYQVRPGLDLKLSIHSGDIARDDKRHQAVTSILNWTNSVLETMSMYVNVKSLANRIPNGFTTPRKVAFTVPIMEKLATSKCSIDATIATESGNLSVPIDSQEYCNFYAAMHGAIAIGYDSASGTVQLNNGIQDLLSTVEEAALKQINKNRLIFNMLNQPNLIQFDAIDIAKMGVKVDQIVADFAGAIRVSSDNETLTNYLIARMYLDLWVHSAGEKAFLSKQIFGQTGSITNNRAEQIDALVKRYASTGVWCDIKTFFKDGYINGATDLLEGRIANGVTCTPLVNYAAINAIIDSEVLTMNQIMQSYRKTIGPFASEIEFGTFDIPLAYQNDVTISDIRAHQGNFLESIPDNGVTADTQLRIYGTLQKKIQPGDKIVIYDGVQRLNETMPMGQTWSLTTSRLPQGSHQFRVAIENAQGVLGVLSSPRRVTISVVCRDQLPTIEGRCINSGIRNTMLARSLANYLVDDSRVLYFSGIHGRPLLDKSYPQSTNAFRFIFIDVESVFETRSNFFMVDSKGDLYSNGVDFFGITTTPSMPIKLMDNVASISESPDSDVYPGASNHFGLLLKKDMSLWVAGVNVSGQLGLGNTAWRGLYTKVLSDVAFATAGVSTSAVVKNDGTVFVAGDNSILCVTGSPQNRSLSFEAVVDNAASVAMGNTHGLILLRDGRVLGCGKNTKGALGMSDRNNYDLVQLRNGRGYAPVVMTKAVKIGAQRDSTMILRSDGSLWVAGLNKTMFGWGILGAGEVENVSTFTKVMDGVRDFSLGPVGAIVQKDDDTIWMTGSNQDGQFGNRTKVSSTTFTKVENPYDVNIAGGAPPYPSTETSQKKKAIALSIDAAN